MSDPRREPETPGRHEVVRRLAQGAVLRIAVVAALTWCTLSVSSATVAPQPGEFEGRVVGVLDGDTIEVLREGRAVRVRLDGIDCPEGGQAFGRKAKQATSGFVFGKTVRVAGKTTDRYGRLVARVHFRDEDGLESDLSLRLVGAGMAWHFTRYSDDASLAAAQRTARERRRGLWADPSAIPPWEYRARRRGEGAAGEQAAVTTPFSGNRRSGVFHQRSCEHFSCSNCVRGFATRAAAIEAGFRPCGRCRP